MKNKFFQLFLQIVWITLALIIGFWIGKQAGIYFSPQKREVHAHIIKSIRPIARIATFKIHHIEELEWSNQSQSKISNILYFKKLYLSAPIIATYGYDSTDFTFELRQDTLTFKIQEPKMLNFEVVWNEKKVFAEKGLLQFENDHQYDALQKLFYEQKRKKYQNNASALKKSKEVFSTQITKFYENLGIKVRIIENS
jgi:hypothetical protein